MTQLAKQQAADQYVTLRLHGQRLALPLPCVRDVQRAQPITPVPHAPSAIAGLVNVRGRSVTALDLRACFALPPYTDAKSVKLVVVEFEGERFALMADALDDVVNLAPEQIGKLEAKDAQWEAAASGVATQKDERIVVLDLAQFLAPLVK